MKRIVSLALTIALMLGLMGCGQDVAAAWQEQYDLGVRYLSEGNYEEAIIAFTAAIEIDSKDALAYLGRAQTRVSYADDLFSSTEELQNWSKEQMELYALAESDYQNAIDLENTLIDAYVGLADLYMAQKRWSEAQKIIYAGLQYNEDNIVLQQKVDEILDTQKQSLERLFRQMDYAILLAGYHLQGTLDSFIISDADQDGLDELFITCHPSRYQDANADIIFAFDEKDGKPYCLSTGFLAATGSRELLYSNGERCPVVMDSFASMASGLSESYYFWSGSNWEEEISYQAEPDFEAMENGTDLAYKNIFINYQGSNISFEEYQANIQQMDLVFPLSDIKNAESYSVGQLEMETFSRLLSQHLSLFYPGDQSRVLFDVDGDGYQEELWTVTGVTDGWYANDPQHERIDSEMGIPEISGTILLVIDNTSEMLSLSFGIAPDVEITSLRDEEELFLVDVQGESHQFHEIAPDTRELVLNVIEDPMWDLLFNSYWYLLDTWGYYAYCYRFEDTTHGIVDMLELETGEWVPELSGDPLEFMVNQADRKIIIEKKKKKIVYDYIPEHEYGAMLLQSMEESEFAGEEQRILWSFPKDMAPTEIMELLYKKERLMRGW